MEQEHIGMNKEIIGDDYPTYEGFIKEYHSQQYFRKEFDKLAELFSYECTLNSMIHEFGGYKPTLDIANKMQELNRDLLDVMNARKKEMGIAEHWGYEDEPKPSQSGCGGIKAQRNE